MILGIQSRHLHLELLDFIRMQLSSRLPLLDLLLSVGQVSLSDLKSPQQVCSPCTDHSIDRTFVLCGLDYCWRLNPRHREEFELTAAVEFRPVLELFAFHDMTT